MATIIEFRGGHHSAQRRVLRSACEIVLFPGVRYERWEAKPVENAQARPKRRTSRKRDKLELLKD